MKIICSNSSFHYSEHRLFVRALSHFHLILYVRSSHSSLFCHFWFHTASQFNHATHAPNSTATVAGRVQQLHSYSFVCNLKKMNGNSWSRPRLAEELIEWVVKQKMYSEKWRMNATWSSNKGESDAAKRGEMNILLYHFARCPSHHSFCEFGLLLSRSSSLSFSPHSFSVLASATLFNALEIRFFFARAFPMYSQ